MSSIFQGPRGLNDVVGALRSGGSLRFAGLGDSLTQGWMVSSGFYDRFVAGVIDAHGGAHIESHNAGVPGDTSGGGLGRLDGVLSRSPDLVVIQFGINDMWCSVPPERFALNMKLMVEGVAGEGAVPVLATSCPMPDEASQADASIYFGAIRDMGNAMGVTVADLDAHWRRNAALGDMRTSDRVHPDDRGHALMARALIEIFL